MCLGIPSKIIRIEGSNATKDEFIYLMNEMIRHCKEKGYLSEDISYEIDVIARDVCKMHMK